MRSIAIRLGLLALGLSILGSSIDRVMAQAVLQCSGAQKSTAVAELLFGRKIGDRIVVTESKWARFVDQEITSRFPDGLSIVDANGQWRDRVRNVIVREPSKLVTIVLPGQPDDQSRLSQIIETYKGHFKQQSVGLILRPACVSF